MKYLVFFVRIASAFIMLFSPSIIYNQVLNSNAMAFGFLSMYVGKLVGLIIFLFFINSAVTFLYKCNNK